MNKLAHFHKYKLAYEIGFLVLYFLINNTLLATSVVMEAQRNNEVLPFNLWEPFVWEYSSAVGSLLLFPFLIFLLDRFPFNWQRIPYSIGFYFVASIIFSFAHVGMMVAMRKLVYRLNEMTYDFGNLWFELFYEYRKDLWGFIFFLIAIQAYRFILSRLQGEASPISQGEESANANDSPLERFIVRKLGKEFIVRVDDIDWMESSGNYVNLHVRDRIYPLRGTLSKLSEQLKGKGFVRVHRSFAINLDRVESIKPLESGDSEITLTTGQTLNLSRRYKDAFKSSMQLT
ncbi:MAG: LytR/AlgR family response regulator transcription factor [Aestuariibacter sp.]